MVNGQDEKQNCNSATAADTVDERFLRTFTHAQIEERSRMRTDEVPEYRSLLMECAVDSTKNGVVFNVRHPSWAKLIQLVRDADSLKQQQQQAGDQR